MKFTLPSPNEAKSEVMNLYRKDIYLQEQQTEIRDKLNSNREAKERFIDSYLLQLNSQLELIGLYVDYQEFVGLEDGSPSGILAHSRFVLEDEDSVVCILKCSNFFHPEHKINCLISFLAMIQEHANKKLHHITLEHHLEQRLEKHCRIKL